MATKKLTPEEIQRLKQYEEEIIESPSMIYDNLTRKYGAAFIEKSLDYLKWVSVWMDRNAEVLSSKALGERITFYESDTNTIFNTFGVDPLFIQAILNKNKSIDKKWIISNEKINILMYVLIFFYYSKRKDLDAIYGGKVMPHIIANEMLSARFFSTIIIKYFRHVPDRNIMFYTLENLTNKFTITKMNSIYEMIQYMARTNLEAWEKDSKRINSREDLILDAYMRKLNARISSNIKNISRVFYDNYEKDKRIITESNTVEYEDGKTQDNVTTSVSMEISIIQRKITSNLNLNGGVDTQILNKICRKLEVSYTTMYKVLNEIHGKQDDRLEEIIKGLLSYFLITKKYDANLINSATFYTTIIQAYQISNTNDPYIKAVKEALNSLLTDYSETYRTTSRKSTIANFRSCLYTYTVLLIMKLNK